MNSLHPSQISDNVAIETSEHLSEVVRQANENDTPVLPIGGGTCLSTGHPVEHPFISLDMRGLNGVMEYVPTDMTASFLSGTPVGEVRSVLAENGQELPIDLADDDAGTIGGLVATGFSGPRRYGQGTLKDLLIGCEYVRGDGLLAKAGGMTVKNVSGFEITRLLHGSWGSLAVLTRVNLKVIPKARVDQTLVWQDASLDETLARQQRLLAGYPAAIALQSVQHSDCWETSIRFAGRDVAIDAYIREVSDLVGVPDGIFTGSEIWSMPAATVDVPHLIVSGTQHQSLQTIQHLAQQEFAAEMSVSFGIGTVRVQINPELFLSGDVETLGSNLWMIEGGSDDWKAKLPVWGPERPDRFVMQSIKMQFDPGSILNRGRLFV